MIFYWFIRYDSAYMNIPAGIFKSYDIRGIYPEDINEQNIATIVQAIYKVQCEKSGKDQLTVVTGHDMRLSVPSLYPLLMKALVDVGAQVIDIDLVSTPTFYFSVFHYGYDAGIQLTASHNPSQYTGMKFVVNSAQGLIKIGKSTGMDQVRDYALANNVALKAASGTVTKKGGVLEDDIQNAINLFDAKDIKPFKIVADAANAMGSQYIEGLFKHIPGELTKINFELDGSFPSHQPDPLVAANTADLRKKVLEIGADVGLAPDGDGDRMFFIDEKGQIVPASIITSLVARELLKKNPGATILYDIRYTNTAKKIIEENGGKSDITKVGHAFITEKMHQTGAIFGGESSGHYFFKATGNAENQLPMIIAVLSVMSRENKPLSEIATELMRSFESGEFNFKTDKSAEILEDLKNKYADGELLTIDGIAVEYAEWRFGVRTSNTEPLLRLNVEAYAKEMMEEKRDELIQFIESFGAVRDHGH